MDHKLRRVLLDGSSCRADRQYHPKAGRSKRPHELTDYRFSVAALQLGGAVERRQTRGLASYRSNFCS